MARLIGRTPMRRSPPLRPRRLDDAFGVASLVRKIGRWHSANEPARRPPTPIPRVPRYPESPELRPDVAASVDGVPRNQTEHKQFSNGVPRSEPPKPVTSGASGKVVGGRRLPAL